MINKALTPAEHYTERMNDGFWKHYISFVDENGKTFHVVFHHFTKPDQGYPHDHPFTITSHIIEGGYNQDRYDLQCDELVCTGKEFIAPGTVNIIHAGTVHKITDLPTGEAWTIAKYGPTEQKSGFFEFTEDEVRHRFWDEQEFKTIKTKEQI